MSNQFLDELLNTLDLIDKKTIAMQEGKRTTLITLGFNKIGDKHPITKRDVDAWINLWNDYSNALKEGYSQYAESVRVLLFGATFILIARSFTSQNADYLFDKLSARWKI
jgi:hypothetical protein